MNRNLGSMTRLVAGWGVALGLMCVSSGAFAAETVFQEGSQDQWTVAINAGPSASDGVAEGKVSEYEQVYRSIPFRRSEYVANPSYRHEATMEFLFDQLRPLTKIQYGSGRTVDEVDAGLLRAWQLNRSTRLRGWRTYNYYTR